MGDKNCSVSIVPQRVDQLLNGLMANYRQTDFEKNMYVDRFFPEVKQIWIGLIECWKAKACNNWYTKSRALKDSAGWTDEIVKDMEKAVQRVVHDAAKYRIPRIITDMEAARAYEDVCSQLLMCDVLDKLDDIDFDGFLSKAHETKLKTVKDYAAIQVENITAATKQYDVMARLTSYEHGTNYEKNHMNSDLITEVLLLSAFYAIMAYVMDNIFNKARDKDIEGAKAVMAECAG